MDGHDDCVVNLPPIPFRTLYQRAEVIDKVVALYILRRSYQATFLEPILRGKDHPVTPRDHLLTPLGPFQGGCSRRKGRRSNKKTQKGRRNVHIVRPSAIIVIRPFAPLIYGRQEINPLRHGTSLLRQN